MTETPVAVDIGRFTDDPRRSFTLPSAVYTDPAVLELERERIFWRSWILVAHESDVADTGAYVTVDLLGQPIFLIRSEDDELRGFYNVYQHRGHLLLEGRGVAGKRITCPYHAWAYDSAGVLKGARMSDRMDGFDHAEFTLPSVRVETMAGFIFVNLDDEARSMDEVYPGLADELDRLAFHDGPLAAVDTATFDIAGNWKNVADNLLECYHCHPAHPGFVDLIDMDGYRNDCHENWSVQSGPLRPGTEVYDAEEGAQTFASVFIWPNVSIGHIPGQRGRLIFQFFPTGARPPSSASPTTARTANERRKRTPVPSGSTPCSAPKTSLSSRACNAGCARTVTTRAGSSVSPIARSCRSTRSTTSTR